MACFSWTLPSLLGGGGASEAQSEASLSAALRTAFGLDIWLDVTDGKNADRVVTPAGDWKLVSEEEAVRQSLLRRLITNPGDWRTKPGYGVGARSFVKKRATQATADELVTLIRGQFTIDKRVESVLAVTADWTSTLLRLAVATRLKGRALRERPLLVVTTVR